MSGANDGGEGDYRIEAAFARFQRCRRPTRSSKRAIASCAVLDGLPWQVEVWLTFECPSQVLTTWIGPPPSSHPRAAGLPARVVEAAAAVS
jgi:hypothetical protein